MMEAMLSTSHQVAGRSPQEMVPSWGLSSGLHYWHTGHSAIVTVTGLGEWRPVLQSRCITSIPATMDTLSTSPLGNAVVSGERLTGIHRTGHSILLIIKILLGRGQPLGGVGHRYLHRFFCQLRENYPHASCPDLLTNYLITCLPSTWTIQPGHSLATAQELVYNHVWPFLFPGKINN